MAVNYASKYVVRIDERFNSTTARPKVGLRPIEYSSMVWHMVLNYSLLISMMALTVGLVLYV